jgi:ABC-type bacteriocin/lantibiotic exporter with double-glycine peptidase domain
MTLRSQTATAPESAASAAIGRTVRQFETFLDRDAERANPSDKPLLAAFRLVAQRLGAATVTDPGETGDGDVRTELERLATANGLLLRDVAVSGGFSIAGDEPLIALRCLAGGPPRPVALLPHRKRWRILDAATMERPEPLDAQTERELLPRAYRISRAFPARPMRKRHLLMFANAVIRLDLASFLLMSLLTGVATSLLAVATGFITTTVIPGREFTLLAEVVVMMILVLLGNAGTRLVAGLTQLRMDGRMGSILRTAAIDRMVRSKAAAIRGMPPPIQMLSARMVEGWHRTIRHVGLSLVAAASIALPSLIVMAALSFGTALIVLAAIAVAASIAAAIVLREMKAMQEGSKGPMGWLSTSYESLAQIDTVRSSHAEAFMFSRWADGFLGTQGRMLNAERIGAGAHALQGALQVVILFVTILTLMITHQLDSDAISVTFVMASMTVAGAATTLVGSFAAMGTLGMQAKMIEPLLADVPPARPLTVVPRLRGAVQVSGVWARREPDGPYVLRNVDFQLKPGQHVGIVGASGSGKSTLVQTILGLLTPDQGVVAYDGIDLRKLDAAGVRRQIGLAGQGSKLFAGSIRDNVKAGLELTDDEIWQALAIAEVAADVSQFGLGLSTVINDADPTMSGGQAQRILLARAIAMRPSIVVLDEATSAIDPPTRERITRSLDRLGVGIIAIAHRLETLVSADCIYVLDQGEIIERGRFDELVARDGEFAKLFALECA